MKRINYKGSSKILKRLCDLYNSLLGEALLKEDYDTNRNGVVDNSEKVNGHNVFKDVPSDAKFTDTIYDDTYIRGLAEQNTRDIQNIADAIFRPEYSYLTNDQGEYIVNDQGERVVIAQYNSLIDQIQEVLQDLQSRKYIYYAEPEEADNGR